MKLFHLAALALLLTTAHAHAVPVTLRVVDADNAPIAGAFVQYADYAEMSPKKPDVTQSAQTMADGKLTLDLRGVSGRAGEVEIRLKGQAVLGSARVRDAKLGYGIVALLAGENTLMVQETSRVVGTIRDANDAPLAGAQVTFVSAEKSEKDYSNMSAQYGLAPILAITNADGSWALDHLPRGYARFSVKAPDAAKDELAFWIDKTETTAPDLKLRAAGIVRGRILDFQGRPVPSAYVYLDDDYSEIADSDDQGRFELGGVPVGESALAFNSSAPDWTGVTTEIKAKISTRGAIVDIGDVRTGEGLLLSGAVVEDLTEAPIAGVKLQMFGFGAIFQTDAQGRFEARVQKPFYGLKVLGDYTQKEVTANVPEGAAKFDMGTIEVERLGATFRGRVTDQTGAPILNARVGWNDQAKLDFAAPDANGNFVIQGLPYKTLVVSASDGFRYAETKATPGQSVQLKLPPAKAPLSDDAVEKLWEQLDVKRISDLERYAQTLGNRRVFEVARRLDTNATPTQIGDGLSGYIRARLRNARTPAERAAALDAGYQLVRLADVNDSNAAMPAVAVAAARSEDEELRAFAATWYEAQKPLVKPLDSPDKTEWYHIAQTRRVMQVGAALGRDDATKYRDIWLTQIDKPNQTRYFHQYLPEWGETLWQAEPKWFDEIVGVWPAPQQMRALGGALSVESNPAQAKALLARLEKLASDPAVAAADAAKPDGGFPESANALYRGRTNFARSMALVDAPAALDALDKVLAVINSSEVYEIALTIARAAIADGQNEIARRALKLGLRDSYTGGSGAPALVLVARGFDAKLADELMEVARKNAATNVAFFDPPGWSDVAAYAIALRDVDASAGRLMLEDQWAKRQQMPGNPNFTDKEYLNRQLLNAQEKLAWAMAFYDVPRALQWLSEIKDDRDEWNNGLERTRLAIIVAALTPPERRSLLLGATSFN